MKDFDTQAQRAHGKPFLKLSQQQRVVFAQGLHDGAVAEHKARRQKRREWRELEEQDTVPVSELRSIKKQLMSMLSPQMRSAPARPVHSHDERADAARLLQFGVGTTQILQYLPVPGRLQSCIPLSEAGNGKTWALETSYKF